MSKQNLDSAIRDRFISLIREELKNSTLKEIAKNSATSESYLSQIQSKPRKLRALIIAQFCLSYNYSAHWVLTGKGQRKLYYTKTKEDKLIDTIKDQQDTIRGLLEALIELKSVWTNETKQLAQEAKKYNKS